MRNIFAIWDNVYTVARENKLIILHLIEMVKYNSKYFYI